MPHLTLSYRLLLNRLLVLFVIMAFFASAYGMYSYRRPLPQTNGSLRLAGLRDEVSLYRDAWGVPHIYATNTYDLFFAQGYVEAQDHWWQMEVNRHLGRGQLNRIYGGDPQVLATDRFVTALDWATTAENDWLGASGAVRSTLQAYSAGINSYIEGRNQGDLAVQYTVLGLTGRGFEITPWQPSDTLAWLTAYHWQMSSDFADDLTRLKVGAQHPQADLPSSYRTKQALPAQAEWEFIGGDAHNLALMPRYLPPQAQAWVIPSSLSDTGKPILANSFYHSMSIPQPWYEVGLHCLEVTPTCPYDVVGISLVGVPGVLAGHNTQIAWGLAATPIKTQHLSLVQLNPRWPVLYRHEGGWGRFQSRPFLPQEPNEETRPTPLYRGPQGVIVTELREGLSSALALDWQAPDSSAFIAGLLKINQAGDWASFQQAVQSWDGAPHTFIYADTAGGIGLVSAGQVAAWSAAEWQAVYYPPEAQLMTALVAPSSYIGTESTSRLYALTQGGQATLASQALAQSDTYQRFSLRLRSALADLDWSAFPPEAQAHLSAQRDWLAAWDGYSRLESPQAVLFNFWWVFIVERVFDAHLGYATGGLLLERQAILELLEQPNHPWWDDLSTPDSLENRDQLLASALELADQAAQDQLGNRQERWRWGDLLRAEFRTVAFDTFDMAALLNRNAGLLDGDFYSLKGSQWSSAPENRFEVLSAPAWRLLIDLNDFNQSRSILATGQSGHPASPHYDDMIDLWRNVAYKDMLWEFETIRQEYESLLILRPSLQPPRQSEDT